MKPKRSPISFLFCLMLCLTTAAPVLAENPLDVIEAAQSSIRKKYPDRDSIARRVALEKLEQIARSGKTDGEIVADVLELFPEASAELFARSDLNSNGVPDEWEKSFKVMPGFTSAESDEDADGFTLLEEYRAGTDPVDPLGHPKFVTRIFVVSVSRRRITGLELISVDGVSVGSAAGPLVTFNTIRDGRKKTESVRVHDSFMHNNERFVVDDVKIDSSMSSHIVYIRHVGMSERIPCRLLQPVYIPVPRVRFLDSIHARTFVLPVGATFKLGSKKTGEETYRIVSADPEARIAVVESVGEKPETFGIQPVPHDVLAEARAAAEQAARERAAAAATVPPIPPVSARKAELGTNASSASAGTGAAASANAPARRPFARPSADRTETQSPAESSQKGPRRFSQRDARRYSQKNASGDAR